MLFSKAVGLLSLLSVSFAGADASGSVSDADRLTITKLQTAKFGSTLGSTCACTVLDTLFHGKVLFPGSAAYTAEATHYWDLRADLSPKCVFVPATASDVAKGVVVLNVCQSQFAIRAGGHMPVKGAANTDGGVLVALSALKTLALSADQKSVQAGPALNWFQMYSFLEPYGRIVVGGRLKTIGISGLTIGGGISYFTAKYGFAMDNVLAYEIVTANGKVVTASATSNSDLFWAMKGGGSNFGIVTKFTFATYKVPSISTSTVIFAEASVPDYITAVANLANHQDQVDTGAGGIFTIGYNPSTKEVQPRFQGVQAGSTIKPAVFSNFTSMPSIYASHNVTTLAYWSSTLDTPYQISRNVYGMQAVLADDTSLQAMFTTYKAGSAPMANIAGFSTNLVFQPIPKSATTVAKTNGVGNTWGIDNTKGYVYWLLTCQWDNAADDEAVTAWSAGLRDKIHAANVKAGTGLDFLYMNDCSDVQKPFASLPAANLAKLKTIRKKYDPTLVFKKLNSGGYKMD